MRLLVLNYEYPPLGGGAGNATYHLCREWGELGHTIDIVTCWYAGLEEVTLGPKNVTVYRVKSKRNRCDRSNPLEMVSYIRHGSAKAMDLVKRHAYDIVISFFAIPTGVISYRLFKKFSLPYIVLLRGGDVPGFLHKELGFFHVITMPLSLFIWRNAACIIANSKSLQLLANKTAKHLHRTVDMVPNGVDVNFFKPATNRQNEHFTFIFSGRFVPQKNLIYLLQQFEFLTASHQIKLILVGDGPDKANLEKKIMSSQLLSQNVSLCPWSSKGTLRSFYQTAHCFVNPSFEEGMPNTVLEAMASGLPVIASDIGGNNELIENGKNGFLFDMNSPHELRDKMQRMLSKADSKMMGEFSRRIASDKFSWNKAALQILSFIERTRSPSTAHKEMNHEYSVANF